MKINKLFIVALGALTLFSSCQGDDDINELPGVEEGDYANGIFILNEGGFGSGNSSVSFLDANHEEVEQDIFPRVNAGAALGDVAQSISFFEDYAFIVVNVSNKIEVVNRNTFELVGTIDNGLENPRYVAFANGNAYVTNWGDGSDPNDDYVAVIDINDLSISENISVEEGPEAIVAEDGSLYVAHQGGFSFNDKISVISSANNSVTETIVVGDVPNSMVIANGSLWVSTAGLPSYAEEETAGKLVEIDLAAKVIVNEMEFPNATDHPDNLSIEGSTLYYTLGNFVYSLNTDEEALPDNPLVEMSEVASLYGFTVHGGNIYAASANADFTGNGDLYIYSASNGSLLESFEVGVNPNGIYINE